MLDAMSSKTASLTMPEVNILQRHGVLTRAEQEIQDKRAKLAKRGKALGPIRAALIRFRVKGNEMAGLLNMEPREWEKNGIETRLNHLATNYTDGTISAIKVLIENEKKK